VQPERPRARRYPFIANVELTDVQSQTQITGRTSDLSLFGCLVVTLRPLSAGIRVRIKIVHTGKSFSADGRVAYARPNAGVGVVFTKIESNDQLVLERWISKLRQVRAVTSQ
jgi:hypothetical protein